MHADAIFFTRQTLLVRCLAVAGRTLWKGVSILRSWHLSVCYLGFGSLNFSEFWYLARKPYEGVPDSLILWKTFLSPKIGEMAKNKVFWIKNFESKIWWLIFTEFVLQLSFLFLAVFKHKSYIWEESCSWDLGQNALSQSDYRIFKLIISIKLAVSQKWASGLSWVCACWYKLKGDWAFLG